MINTVHEVDAPSSITDATSTSASAELGTTNTRNAEDAAVDVVGGETQSEISKKAAAGGCPFHSAQQQAQNKDDSEKENDNSAAGTAINSIMSSTAAAGGCWKTAVSRHFSSVSSLLQQLKAKFNAFIAGVMAAIFRK